MLIQSNSKTILLSLSVLLTGAPTLTSCGKVNSMQRTTQEMAGTTKGMAKNTEDMTETTKKMADTTGKMSETTNRMEETTCYMYTALRQGNSKASRDQDLEAMGVAKDINEKLELAAKYMQGFEYQVWSTACKDITPREISIDQAATELLTVTQPHTKDRSKVKATKLSSDYMTLYSLAATLHRTNSLQEAYLQGTGLEALRPLDILVKGLTLNRLKNQGSLAESLLPQWARTVGKYTSDAEFILRLRGNFLMAYGYAIADSDDFGNTPNKLEKLWRIGSTQLLSKKWTPNLEKRDPTEIAERITQSLILAKETQDQLIQLGIDPMVDGTILKIWKNADFEKLNLESMELGSGDNPARARAIRQLIQARDQLVK